MFARVASFEGRDARRLQAPNGGQMAAGTLELPDGLRRAMLPEEIPGLRTAVDVYETVLDESR
jgi:hypothetical protein